MSQHGIKASYRKEFIVFQILVVDDDKNIRFFIKEVLEINHYTAHCASNGNEALEVFNKTHIDLVIVDIMMPGMDGYEFTKKLRDANSTIPILMMSAKQLSEDRKKGFLLGIDDYMTKPIDLEELLLHVKALLRRYQIESERKLVVNDIVLDYDLYQVKKNNDVIELPQKEFLLLFKLLSYPERIFTRIQLMDEIWGYDCETGWETLTVHINRLRKKFEDWNAFQIVSVRGLGYKAVINNENK